MKTAFTIAVLIVIALEMLFETVRYKNIVEAHNATAECVIVMQDNQEEIVAVLNEIDPNCLIQK